MSENKSPKRAVIYVRISKDRENETSTDTQEAEARALCERRGWAVAKVEVDAGRSAYKAGTRRPGFDRALELIERGHADVLVVWKLDRLHRGLVDFWSTWSRLEQAGAELASVTDELDTSRTAGRMMVGLLAGFAEMESEARSDRAKAWHEQRRAKALPPAGRTPFGYRRENGTLTVVPPEAAQIRSAASKALEGRSLRKIAEELGTTHRGARMILTNPTTSGRREIEGTLVPGSWPAILEVDQADELRALLLDPSRRTITTNERRWMLAGIARCACGGSMRSKQHPNGKRYLCRECGKSIKAETLDGYVTEALFAVVTPEVWDAARRAGKAPAVDTSELGDRIAEIAVDYAAGRIDRAVYEAAKAEQARIIAEAEAEPVELPELEDLVAGWAELGAGDRALVVTAFTEAISVRCGAGPLTERVSITWRA